MLTKTKGESLLEFIVIKNLSIANEVCDPTFVTSDRREVLDIPLGNELMTALIGKWRVSSEHVRSPYH